MICKRTEAYAELDMVSTMMVVGNEVTKNESACSGTRPGASELS